MMSVFATRMFKDKYKSLVFYCIGAVALLEMYVALFPAIREQAVNFDKMLKSFPPELFKAMNMDPSTLSFTTLESYISSEYMSFLWPILAVIFAISLANYISVNEVEKRTSEILLSLPASRTRIFLERYFTGLAILAVFCAVSLYGVIPLAMLHKADFIAPNYTTASVGSFLFAWACYSLATISSVMFSEKGRANMVSSGLLILMYVMFVVSTLQSSVSNLRYFSFFNYFSGGSLLANNTYPENIFLTLGGFSIIAMTVSLIRFKRRDMSV